MPRGFNKSRVGERGGEEGGKGGGKGGRGGVFISTRLVVEYIVGATELWRLRGIGRGCSSLDGCHNGGPAAPVASFAGEGDTWLSYKLW